MKRLLWLAIMAAAIVAPSAQAPAGLDAAVASIDTAVAADFAKDGVGGLSIGVVSGDQLIWSRHYGYADAEAKRVADNDTAYRVGSITKQFTALALLQLVETHQMRLTDPLEKYVPEVKQVKSPPAGAPPTILQVAMMTSGLAREPECDHPNDGSSAEWQKIVLRCLPKTSYVNEPGTTYLYSNIGYATLGLAIERAGRQPFIDQVRDRILVPLGMSRSAMGDASTAVRANLAHGYQPSKKAGGKPSREDADRGLDGRGYRVPNGGLFSTVNDLAKFAAWEMGDGPSGILKKETQDANYSRAFFHGPEMYIGYGVGFIIRWLGPVLMLGHGGSTDGYHSWVMVHRPTHLGVIVLRNCDDCPVDAGPVAAAALEKLVTAKGK